MKKPGAQTIQTPGTGTLSIRQWMLVGIGIFLVLAGLFYHLSTLLGQNLMHPSQQTQQQQKEQEQAINKAMRDIAGSPVRWRDPAWQDAERVTLARLGVEALVLDPSGREIFRTDRPVIQGAPGEQATRQMAVVQADGSATGGQMLGTVALFGAGGASSASVPAWASALPLPLPVIGAVLAIALALFFVRIQMGKYVVKPLEAMGEAARQIANGDLDFELPRSRVREVAEVSQAFEAMGEGLRQSLRRQADLEEERRFFVGAIAHDLRTPLFSLRGYLEGLEQGLASSPQKAAEYVAVCRQKADQLDRLVSDLFAYTRVEYLEQTLQWGQVDLGALLRRAVEGVGPRVRDKGATLEIEHPDESREPCIVQGDVHLLERVVENLLDNALRYTPRGGRIEVGWRGDEKQVVFTVADTGPGIAPSDMQHLFDPLYRGESSRNRDTGGAGLGLAIARRVLVAHGGDLQAANCPAGGAQFTGRLPLHSTPTHLPVRNGLANSLG